MNKKGFTLIELIVVIVLLSLISLVVFPAVFKTLNTSKQMAYESQKEIVLKAAKEYYLDNIDLLPETKEESETSIELKDLIKNGYINEDEIINPKNNHVLNGKVKVSYLSNKYVYEFIEIDN